LVLEDPGITADPVPYYTGRYLDGVVEFAFLDAVMHDPRVDLGLVGGIVQATAHAAYWANHARAAEELGAEAAGQYPWLVETMAAYMTIGGWDVPDFVRSVVLESTGLEIEATGYDSSQHRHLDPQADADNDAVTNLEEWEMGGSLTEPLADLLDRMLDPELDDMPEPEPLDSLHCWNDDLSAPGPGSGYLRMDQGGMAFRAWVKLEPGGKGIELTHGQLTGGEQDIIRAGRIIELRVKPDQDEAFHQWYIPGTLADGSSKKRVEFTFNADTGEKSAGGTNFFALAMPRARTTLLVPPENEDFAYTAEPSGPFADQVNVSTDALGRTVYDAPFGTRFRVAVSRKTPPVFPATRYNVLIHGVNNDAVTESSSATVTLPRPITNGEFTLGNCPSFDLPGLDYVSLCPPNVPHAVSSIGFSNRPAIFGGSFRSVPPIAASSVALYCDPEPGYYIDGWVGASGTPTCSSPWQGLTVTESATVPGKAVKPCTTLNVRVEIEDAHPGLENADKAAAGGLVVANDAQTFYVGERLCLAPQEGEVVQLTAQTRCGYIFTGWTGNAEVYTNALASGDPVTLNSDTPLKQATIYIIMKESVKINAMLAYPYVIMGSGVEIGEQVEQCEDIGYEGRQEFVYRWDSSTGILGDLTGKFKEILAFNYEPSIEDVMQKVRAKSYAAFLLNKWLVLDGWPAGTTARDYIPDSFGLQNLDARLYAFGGATGALGVFPDSNNWSAKCDSTCTDASCYISQYFVYVDSCGFYQFLGGPHRITRSFIGASRTAELAKHGQAMRSQCADLWSSTCPCAPTPLPEE
ncbi:MAG: hypothetical protein GXY15_09830, partial [Candidatus Hydrogenedentes bacterium]|nr:hypothetical protein [Candidatus Hydrogenedentota bacterium]